ncbi:MAG: hypothetical protein GY787_21440 [Alteromonadales bacterium]|nr:hypothetical protein [Alteromonadales bacterium]
MADNKTDNEKLAEMNQQTNTNNNLLDAEETNASGRERDVIDNRAHLTEWDFEVTHSNTSNALEDYIRATPLLSSISAERTPSSMMDNIMTLMPNSDGFESEMAAMQAAMDDMRRDGESIQPQVRREELLTNRLNSPLTTSDVTRGYTNTYTYTDSELRTFEPNDNTLTINNNSNLDNSVQFNTDDPALHITHEDGRHIKFELDGKITVMNEGVETKECNVFDMLDRLESLEIKVAALLEHIPKRLSSKMMHLRNELD